jgi:DNA (cytosine-5)-methyltransferase 1
MGPVKFYLDKADKNGFSMIHLVMIVKGEKLKLSTRAKVKKYEWDAVAQRVKKNGSESDSTNYLLSKLCTEIQNIKTNITKTKWTKVQIQTVLSRIVEDYMESIEFTILKEDQEYLKGKSPVTFIDLFAGAGGFSEGFLQAELNKRYFEFLLASDINENCELTHLVRYNYQLGIDMQFLRQDITEPDFIDNLLTKLKDKAVDVVCGGPPCQSFSLAGKRKKFDKKDDLFSHYLDVIRQLRPKYFVMENVKGILTKEGGKIKDMILQEIRSIIDPISYPSFISFVKSLLKEYNNDFVFICLSKRLEFECLEGDDLNESQKNYLDFIASSFRSLTSKILDYKTSKTDPSVLTIRHGLNLLERKKELAHIRKLLINEKALSDVDNDYFADDFDSLITNISTDSIIQKIEMAFKRLPIVKKDFPELKELITALELFNANFDECVNLLSQYAEKKDRLVELETIVKNIRLYNITKPFVALASNYGVPQNRERVLFIGCRKDQNVIEEIPPTVKPTEKVTVFEAIFDLDFIGNDEEKVDYEKIDLDKKYNGKMYQYSLLLGKRDIDGKIDTKKGTLYSDWSKKGRLNGRFTNMSKPFYVKSFEELESRKHFTATLHNHKTSKQNDDVIKRLEIILKTGNYDLAKKNLKTAGVESDKRNYNVLKPDSQSPTILTMPDDYIHYNSPRALTVREMARLQSFDDSFVFQGKRSTGGNKRKFEVPQFTLVGNAVPPLMARAVAMELLRNIK